MNSERCSKTLNRIDAALRRLDEGSYGNCFQCGDEIAQVRLRALPFALRCKDCFLGIAYRRAFLSRYSCKATALLCWVSCELYTSVTLPRRAAETIGRHVLGSESSSRK